MKIPLDTPTLNALAALGRAGDRNAVGAALLELAPLVRSRARRFGRCSPDAIDDLRQEGALGVLHALRKWSATGGASFRTYARIWIDSYIRKAVKMQIPIVRPQQRTRNMKPAVWLDAPLSDGTTLASRMTDPGPAPDAIADARQALRAYSASEGSR